VTRPKHVPMGRAPRRRRSRQPGARGFPCARQRPGCGYQGTRGFGRPARYRDSRRGAGPTAHVRRIRLCDQLGSRRG
jgi:hypothetical protein